MRGTGKLEVSSCYGQNVTLNSYVETMAKVKALGGDDFRK
jgi:hypothetical protein